MNARLITALLILLLPCAAFANFAMAQDENGKAEDEESRHVDDQPIISPHENPATILQEIASNGTSLLTKEPLPERTFLIDDLIKIKISESHTATDTAKLDTKRDFEVDASIEEYFQLTSNTNGLLPKFVTPNGVTPTLELDSEVRRKNQGSTSQTNSFQSFITGKIVDIKEDRVIVISAEKRIVINEEVQIIRLTGMVRPSDVDLDNTVDSIDIAELNVEYIGSGPVSDAAKRGLVGKIFDAIWPFR